MLSGSMASPQYPPPPHGSSPVRVPVPLPGHGLHAATDGTPPGRELDPPADRSGVVALGATLDVVTAADVFQATVEAVRRAGIPHYRRQHVGHGIGVGLAGAAVGYIVIEEILRATRGDEKKPGLSPTAGGTENGAFVGLTGRF